MENSFQGDVPVRMCRLGFDYVRPITPHAGGVMLCKVVSVPAFVVLLFLDENGLQRFCILRRQLSILYFLVPATRVRHWQGRQWRPVSVFLMK